MLLLCTTPGDLLLVGTHYRLSEIGSWDGRICREETLLLMPHATYHMEATVHYYRTGMVMYKGEYCSRLR